MSDTPFSAPEPLPLPPVFDPGMFPSGRKNPLHFLLDHNPCFLLSTVLMLLGCYLINGTIDNAAGVDGDRMKLLSLLGVTNLYEACIIPLGLLLIRRTKGAARDGLWLLLFECLFLVNGTFLNVDPSIWGWNLNVVLLLLAVGKAGVIFYGLRLPLASRAFGFVAGQLVIIYAMPVFFRAVSVDGKVPLEVMYGLYWVVGMLPVAYDVLARAWGGEARGAGLAQQVVRRTYVILPWLLVVAHLGFSHWAHYSTFQFADVSPLLLGVAAATLRVRGTKYLPGSELRFVRVALPILAVLFSIDAEPVLGVSVMGVTLSPVVMVGGAAMLLYGYYFSVFTMFVVMAGLVVAGVSYVLRGVFVAATRAAADASEATLRFSVSLIPATPMGWGIYAIIAAFALLMVGAYYSLRRARPEGQAG